MQTFITFSHQACASACARPARAEFTTVSAIRWCIGRTSLQGQGLADNPAAPFGAVFSLASNVQTGVFLAYRPLHRWARAALPVLLSSLLWACQKSATDHMALANAAIAAKEPTAAVLHLKNALAKDPNSGEGRMMLGTQELAAGDSGAAVIDLRRARELKVPDDKVVPVLAEALLASRQGQIGRAHV